MESPRRASVIEQLEECFLSPRKKMLLAIVAAVTAFGAMTGGMLLLTRKGGASGALQEWFDAPRREVDLSFVMATVGNSSIRRGELYDFVLPPRGGERRYSPLWPDTARIATVDLTKELCLETLVRKRGISVSESDLRRRYIDILAKLTGRDMLMGSDEAAKALKARGVDENDLKRSVAILLATERLMKADGIIPPDPYASDAKKKIEDYTEGMLSRVGAEDDPAMLPEGVAMRVGEIEVTRVELARQILRVATRVAGPKQARGALERLVSKRIIENAGKEAGIVFAEDDLDYHMAHLETSYKILPKLKGLTLRQHVMATGRNFRDYTNSLEFRLNAMITRLAREKLGPADIDAALAASPSRYGIGQRSVAHILLSSRDPATGRKYGDDEMTAAGKRIREAHESIASGKADFAGVARKINNDGTEVVGGSLGWISRAEKPGRFAKVAYSLETGAVSEPFQDEEGWHIIRVDASRTIGSKESRRWAECDMLIKLRSAVRRSLASESNIVYSDSLF